MVGRSIDAQYPRVRGPVGEPLLTVEGLSAKGRFEDITLEVRAGEVVGLAGLVGAGRTEVLRAIFGADGFDSGTITVQGKPTRARGIAASAITA